MEFESTRRTVAGLQRKLMIVVHPLAGVVNPSDFDLETGHSRTGITASFWNGHRKS